MCLGPSLQERICALHHYQHRHTYWELRSFKGWISIKGCVCWPSLAHLQRQMPGVASV